MGSPESVCVAELAECHDTQDNADQQVIAELKGEIETLRAAVANKQCELGSLRDEYDELRREFDNARSALDAAHAKAKQLRDALYALGVKGDGYCWCATSEQAEAGHTGECREATAALADAESEKAWKDAAAQVAIDDSHTQLERHATDLQTVLDAANNKIERLREALGPSLVHPHIHFEGCPWIWTFGVGGCDCGQPLRVAIAKELNAPQAKPER